jgi:ribosomal protein S5
MPEDDEIFDPSEFTLLFLDSDSTTLVTSLNRVNHRRVLFFVGNGKGVIGYAKGKGIDYESAFENAFK